MICRCQKCVRSRLLFWVMLGNHLYWVFLVVKLYLDGRSYWWTMAPIVFPGAIVMTRWWWRTQKRARNCLVLEAVALLSDEQSH